MAATMPELVDYAYIAEKLNVSQQTVRVYATGTKQRKAGFPKSALPEGARSPLFHKKEADAFIKRRLEETAGGKLVEISTFPSYWAAIVARSELLEDVYPYRVQLRNTKLASGAGKAFLDEAPRKPLRSYRKKARTTVRQTTRENA